MDHNTLPKKLPVFIGCFGILFPKEYRITEDVLKDLTKTVYEAAGLKPLGEMVIRNLESPIDGYPAFCTVQPLMTSVTALDAWPEHNTVVVIIHSCQEFGIKEVRQKIVSSFPSSKIIQEKETDWSFNID